MRWNFLDWLNSEINSKTFKNYNQVFICPLTHTQHIVMWSTTERKEIRNFPYPFRVWIDRPQRLTVKRKLECRSSYLYSVTSPRWIEKGDIEVHIVVQMNRLTGWRKKKEAEWLARTLKPEVAPFLSEEIGIKNSVLEWRSSWEDVWSVAKTPGEEAK